MLFEFTKHNLGKLNVLLSKRRYCSQERAHLCDFAEVDTICYYTNLKRFCSKLRHDSLSYLCFPNSVKCAQVAFIVRKKCYEKIKSCKVIKIIIDHVGVYPEATNASSLLHFNIHSMNTELSPLLIAQ